MADMGPFDEALRQLKKVHGTTIQISYGLDEKGYLDRECPAPNCLFQFKVLASDWKELFRDEQVFCPLCRHEAPANHWATTEQVEHQKQQAALYVGSILKNALHKGAEQANREQPHSAWLRLHYSFPGPIARHVVVPAVAKEALTLEVQCSQCIAHYAVIGSAFFCPNCGHNSAEQTFEDALRKVSAKLDSVTVVRKAFMEMGQTDAGELVARSLIETALSDCVGALQRLCEELFRRHYPTQTAPFNIFQRLDDASELWHSKLGVGYDRWLSSAHFQEMKLLYQQRHLLAHSEGMVDDKYLSKSLDTRYKAGQRIVVNPTDIRTLINYVSSIASGLRTMLPA
jgi:uncharacterized Zn finger protein (UPF0148 family)